MCVFATERTTDWGRLDVAFADSICREHREFSVLLSPERYCAPSTETRVVFARVAESHWYKIVSSESERAAGLEAFCVGNRVYIL